MEVEHDLVSVDEFDALAIEVKVPNAHANAHTHAAPASSPPPGKNGLNLRSIIIDAFAKDKVGKFPAKQHAQKVAKALGVTAGFIYLQGQVERNWEDSDMGPEFRQRRYFYYLSGVNYPGCFLIYDIAKDHLVLFVPYQDPRYALWYGKSPTADEIRAITKVDDVRYTSGLDRWLYASLTPGCTLYVLHPDHQPKLENTRSTVQVDTIKLRTAMDTARVIKTTYEIAMIRRANAVSSAGHKAVLSRLTKLSNEREVDAIFRGFCIANGAKQLAYPVIAGSGPNAGTLHYDDNNQPLAGRQLICMDAGAEWFCYASDVTRTFPISGSFSPEAAAIHAIVTRMQEECIQRVRPGVLFQALHLHACAVAVIELLRLGILHNGTATEILQRGTVAAFFPHGLGHHVGLEVHDVSGTDRLLHASYGVPKGPLRPDGGQYGTRGAAGKRRFISADSLGQIYRDSFETRTGMGKQPHKQVLEKDMVVTIEPGIYFSRDYIKAFFLDIPAHAQYINKQVLEKYYDVGGVRIEDCILVTEDGYENLTPAPKGDEMLDIINSFF